MKKAFLIFILVIGFFVLIAINNEEVDFSSGIIENISYSVVDYETDYVQLVINDESVVLIELYSSLAPITVENFKSLVLEGYYDGLLFHRVIESFMIQGGDGESTDSIVGEFIDNGYENDISHVTGTISMARTSDYDSASSQFFICLNDTGCAHLDGSYAAFGGVIAGMDSVLEVSLTSTDTSDYPLVDQVITSIKFVEIEE